MRHNGSFDVAGPSMECDLPHWIGTSPPGLRQTLGKWALQYHDKLAVPNIGKFVACSTDSPRLSCATAGDTVLVSGGSEKPGHPGWT